MVDKDGGVMTYSNRFKLAVQSFDIVDENNDGINEPGEYLFVNNIVVRNEGKSPKAHIVLTKFINTLHQDQCLRLLDQS